MYWHHHPSESQPGLLRLTAVYAVATLLLGALIYHSGLPTLQADRAKAEIDESVIEDEIYPAYPEPEEEEEYPADDWWEGHIDDLIEDEYWDENYPEWYDPYGLIDDEDSDSSGSDYDEYPDYGYYDPDYDDYYGDDSSGSDPYDPGPGYGDDSSSSGDDSSGADPYDPGYGDSSGSDSSSGDSSSGGDSSGSDPYDPGPGYGDSSSGDSSSGDSSGSS